MTRPDELDDETLLAASRWLATAYHRIATREAADAFAELSKRFDAGIAHEAFATVLAASAGKRSKGRPRARRDMDGVWLARLHTMPGQSLAAVALAISNSSDGENRSAITIRRRLKTLLDQRKALRAAPIW